MSQVLHAQVLRRRQQKPVALDEKGKEALARHQPALHRVWRQVPPPQLDHVRVHLRPGHLPHIGDLLFFGETPERGHPLHSDHHRRWRQPAPLQVLAVGVGDQVQRALDLLLEVVVVDQVMDLVGRRGYLHVRSLFGRLFQIRMLGAV